MKFWKLATFAVAMTALASAARAEGNLAVTLGGGSPGGTIEAQYALTQHFQIRGGYNYFNYGGDFSADDTDYTGDLDFSGGGLFADYHPLENSFFITGGVYIGNKSVELEIRPNENLVINGVTYTPTEYGTVFGEASFEDIAPFIGLGIDTTFTSDGPFGFQLLAGAAYFGSGQVNLLARGGTLSNDPIITNEIAEQSDELEGEIEDYKYYPIIQAGISYRF